MVPDKEKENLDDGFVIVDKAQEFKVNGQGLGNIIIDEDYKQPSQDLSASQIFQSFHALNIAEYVIDESNINSKDAKEKLEKLFQEKIPQNAANFKNVDKKKSGVASGYIAERRDDGSLHMVKVFDKKFQGQFEEGKFHTTCGDGIREYIYGNLFKQLLYDAAPDIQLMTDEQDNSKFKITSRFIKDSFTYAYYKSNYAQVLRIVSENVGIWKTNAAKTANNILRGYLGFNDVFTVSPEIADQQLISNFEKVVAACVLMGDYDFHDDNILLQKQVNEITGVSKLVACKIDHGRAFSTTPIGYVEVIKDLDNLFNIFRYLDTINEGKELNFNINKFIDALESIRISLNDDLIKGTIESKTSDLVGLGVSKLDIAYALDEIQTHHIPMNYSKKLGDTTIERIIERREALKALIQNLQIISKFSEVPYPQESDMTKQEQLQNFLNGGWISHMSNLFKNKMYYQPDLIKLALAQKIKIDGMNPVEYALKNDIEIEGSTVNYLTKVGHSINIIQGLYAIAGKPLPAIFKSRTNDFDDLNQSRIFSPNTDPVKQTVENKPAVYDPDEGIVVGEPIITGVKVLVLAPPLREPKKVENNADYNKNPVVSPAEQVVIVPPPIVQQKEITNPSPQPQSLPHLENPDLNRTLKLVSEPLLKDNKLSTSALSQNDGNYYWTKVKGFIANIISFPSICIHYIKSLFSKSSINNDKSNKDIDA